MGKSTLVLISYKTLLILPTLGYYATALPALMMFIITKRLYNFIFQVVYFALVLGLILPVRSIFVRNTVNFVSIALSLMILLERSL